ncbi:MAG: alpha/beta hydrolase domain-containing protein [Pseudomonadota bacterium]
MSPSPHLHPHISLTIKNRTPLAQGQAFGEVGPYERIDARAHVAFDPASPAYAGIVDLEHAPRNDAGQVAYTTDVQILKPVDLTRGNARLFVELANRGNKRCLQFFNDALGSNDPRDGAHFGNGFLMRRGYTVAWIAWQGDLLPGNDRLLLDVPRAQHADGSPITGPVRSQFIVDAAGTHVLPLSGWVSTRSYPAASLKTTQATLTRRRYPDSARETIAPDAWSFSRLEGGAGLDNQGAERARLPSATNIHLHDGFEPGWIYELIYTAQDPLVLGLGHAAVRDVTGFLRHADADASGTANPLRESGHGIEKAYAWGRSQTGRCLRDFVYRGFNADPRGGRVFDAMMPHVSGGGLMWMNHRFANVVRPAGQEYEDHDTPADRFPFAYATSRDHLTGARDAICKRPDTDPLIAHTQSSTEYWQRRGSLVHTTTDGEDLPLPANVRVYLWASSQHFADPRALAPVRSVCREDSNIIKTSMLFRAMLDALDAWATTGAEPPASRIPTRGDGTLVDGPTWAQRFPAIPGVMRPRGPASLSLLDYGNGTSAGILAEPPHDTGERYTTLVPVTDGDGNETSGIAVPTVAVPLASFTGWNIRTRAHGHGAMHAFSGSTLPFPRDVREQAQTGDPRASITERYADRSAYLDAVRAASTSLVGARLMLDEDVERCVLDATALWDLVMA